MPAQRGGPPETAAAAAAQQQDAEEADGSGSDADVYVYAAAAAPLGLEAPVPVLPAGGFDFEDEGPALPSLGSKDLDILRQSLAALAARDGKVAASLRAAEALSTGEEEEEEVAEEVGSAEPAPAADAGDDDEADVPEVASPAGLHPPEVPAWQQEPGSDQQRQLSGLGASGSGLRIMSARGARQAPRQARVLGRWARGCPSAADNCLAPHRCEGSCRRRGGQRDRGRRPGGRRRCCRPAAASRPCWRRGHRPLWARRRRRRGRPRPSRTSPSCSAQGMPVRAHAGPPAVLAGRSGKMELP